MPGNVEIKARVNNIDDLENITKQLTNISPQQLIQEDIFFYSLKGRLKLRIFADQKGELIHYERENTIQPKLSNYKIVKVEDYESLKTILSEILGVRGIVKKVRTLYLVGQTRVHLDQVEDLGDFAELEVVLEEGQTQNEGVEIARQLMQKLGIGEEDLVKEAYIDLLEEV